MSSNTGTNKFPSIVLPTIALASTACALLVQNHHRVGHVPAIFKRIFGRFGEKKTKKTTKNKQQEQQIKRETQGRRNDNKRKNKILNSKMYKLQTNHLHNRGYLEFAAVQPSTIRMTINRTSRNLLTN